jgi:hypothetical protein
MSKRLTKAERDQKRAAEQVALYNKITEDAHEQARRQTLEELPVKGRPQ